MIEQAVGEVAVRGVLQPDRLLLLRVHQAHLRDRLGRVEEQRAHLAGRVEDEGALLHHLGRLDGAGLVGVEHSLGPAADGEDLDGQLEVVALDAVRPEGQRQLHLVVALEHAHHRRHRQQVLLRGLGRQQHAILQRQARGVLEGDGARGGEAEAGRLHVERAEGVARDQLGRGHRALVDAEDLLGEDGLLLVEVGDDHVGHRTRALQQELLALLAVDHEAQDVAVLLEDLRREAHAD